MNIEIDGSQHMEQGVRDQARTDFLEHAGYRILRFWNNEVLDDGDAVLESILSELARIEDHSEQENLVEQYST